MGAAGLHAVHPRRAKSSGSSARTARARPRCCSSPSGCCAPDARARSAFSAATQATVRQLARGRLRRAGHADLRRTVDHQTPPDGRAGSTRPGTMSSPSAGSNSSDSTPPEGGSLSGGQRAQLALTLASRNVPSSFCSTSRWPALTRSPAASSSRSLMEIVAEHGVSVVLSSHLIADLERVCDFLVVLVASHVQLAGEVSDLLGTTIGSRGPAGTQQPAGRARKSSRRATPTSSAPSSFAPTGRSSIPAWTVKPVTLGRSRARLHGPGTRHRKQAPQGIERHSMIRFASLQFRTQPRCSSAHWRRSHSSWRSTGPTRCTLRRDVARLRRARRLRDGNDRVPHQLPLARTCSTPWLSSCPPSSESSGAHHSSPASSRPARSGWCGPRASPAPAGSP